MSDSHTPIRIDEAAFRQEYPGASAAATEVAANLARTSTLRNAVYAQVAREFGLSEAGCNVLAVIEGNRSPITPRLIGERVLVTSATVTSVLDTLEKRGLIIRTPHPGDRRSVLVDITEAGIELVDALLPRIHAVEAAMSRALSAHEHRKLTVLLGKLQTGATAVLEGDADIPTVTREVTWPRPG